VTIASPPAEAESHGPRLKLDIVCFADMEWDHILWTNRQHIMSRLPRLDPDVRVLYVAPARFAFARALGAKRLRTEQEPSTRCGLWTRRVAERLWVLQPLLPCPKRIIDQLASGPLEELLIPVVRRAMCRLGFEAPVLWTYTPNASGLVGRLGERLVCYDIVDDYASLPAYCDERGRAADRELSQRADLVFAASRLVHQERSKLNGRCHFVGNAADLQTFGAARVGALPTPLDLDLTRPVAGFYGAITSFKLDLDLIEALTGLRHGWSFVFIGHLADKTAVKRLRALENVTLLGPRPHQQLPSYVSQFSALLVPYRRTPYTERLNALKLYEAMAAGVQIVARNLPCFREFPGLVRLADTASDFAAALDQTLVERDGAERRERQLAAVRELSWEAKAGRMLELIRARVEEAA
jgi:glycosyltransferase involved in cell wall biosynthesis